MTNSERDSGIEARMNAARVDDRDWDIPGPVPAHECTSPNPDTCLVCVLDAVVYEQKLVQKERDEIDKQRNDEWWAS